MARTLEEHRRRVHEALQRIPPLEVMLEAAAGATLAEGLIAEEPAPPLPVAACDGYAVRAQDVADATVAAPVTLVVSHDVRTAGGVPRRHVPRTAARIASGAPLPTGADAVVPTAMTDAGVARVAVSLAAREGDHVRPAGSDAQAGEVLVPQGTRLGARQLAVAAALGRPRLRVSPTPRVVVIAVGGELVEPGTSRTGGGIPESNAHMLAAMVREAGAHAYRVGAVPDERLALGSAIEDQLVRADVLLTTGGLSGGREETLPEVLAQLGEFEVDDVDLRPGGRHGIGAIDVGGDRRVPVIALPGPPVSAAVAFETYVRPALRAMNGETRTERTPVKARMTTAVTSPSGVAHAVPVALAPYGKDGRAATPVGDLERPTLADLAASDALLLVAPEETRVAPGSTVACLAWED
ncbi:gephyrin-like molybdotransferase Glp [Demequina sp. NBRC 110052]|uniref:molybdopterin molybdotransferase MoeA n=1 Tax=Demequina sp. NBRC 110052 TaxID=1570341 RepID=UPI0009FF2628|nr:gephyrin-like molybdotransferase Glp [Demequina sp. NBRC 110052]